MREHLLRRYAEIRNKMRNEPAWAVHKEYNKDELLETTIPFVGKNYAEQDFKILVYASAENLANYDGYLEREEKVDICDRHRGWFNKKYNETRFFPDVHLQPMNDGMLLLAAYYIAYQLKSEYREKLEPIEFMEKIAFGNYGKYSIEGPKNIDYPPKKEEKEKVAMSHDYIREDIRILKPDLIIMPRTIFDNDKNFVSTLQELSDKPLQFCKIYQLNRTTMNCLIKKKFQPREYSSMDEVFFQWNQNVKGFSVEELRYMFGHLDIAIEETKRGGIGD